MNYRVCRFAASFLVWSICLPIWAQSLRLNQGDHICIVGNTLAERMQHEGWLETLLHSRFPRHELVIRNLGYSGDELTIRLRSMDFGSQDQWLSGNAPIPQRSKLASANNVSENRFERANTRADVVFAMFGYNESYGGEQGLAKFKSDLDNFVRHTRSQNYNGRTPPRLVLFSPIAHENLENRNLPDGTENNRRLQLYSNTMYEVAKAHEITFVDLFTASQDLYSRNAQPLTINGVHLNGLGNRLIAEAIVTALFGPAENRDAASLETLRKAVADKNFYWYHRYRTTDGYSTYGDRAFLKFVEGQSNYEVVQRELEVLDVMTSNRDRHIWSVAQGRAAPISDDNSPPFIPVVSNKPGAGPNGTHIFLGGEAAIQQMTVHDGLKVSLFASEEQFPELINPVQMAFDTKGRLWVAAWPTYPHWRPKEPMNDKLLILEDTNGDGKADTCKTFASDLHNPTGFEFWNGGVLVAMAPDLLFLKDTDGDDKYDVRERVLHGLDTADTHHTINSFVFDPGGAVYFQEGTFHHTQVETAYTPAVRLANGGVYRYEPLSQRFEVYVSFGFANPHGHAFDRWGQDIVIDGTGSVPYHGTLFSGRVEFPNKHGRPPTVYQQRTRPCPGIEYLSSRHFPDEFQGNLLVGNVITFQGILRYKVNDQDSSFGATELEPILSSSDPNFRPADLEIGPDGAIWFVDWHNPIIGHMQHNLRDPNRDRTHGRVYRVTHATRPLLNSPKLAGESIEQLLDVLKVHEDRVRYRARLELSARRSDEVIPKAKQWMARLDKNDSDYEHQVLEVLWLHQFHNYVDIDLLRRVLASPDFRARAAAVRVLCAWRDRIPNVLDMLRELANDPSGRVRLEAIRAASFIPQPEAIDVPLIAENHPTDQYLDFLYGETMKTLEPYWKKSLAEGQEIAVSSEAGKRFVIRNLDTETLLKQPKTMHVFRELVFRPGIQDEVRREALAGLAAAEKKDELRVLLDAIRKIDDRTEFRADSVAFDLLRLLVGRSAGDLTQARAELEKLARSAEQPVVRQLSFVTLVNADQSVDGAWKLALSSHTNLIDMLNAVPLIGDTSLRANLYDRIVPLLDKLPENLQPPSDVKASIGRFVRIELPGDRRCLTLAEVEVFSNGRNVARSGTASQIAVANDGVASRAIDGNRSGRYGDGGQTHTPEQTRNPWWEVDLGADVPIEKISIFNRTESNLGSRLNRFSLIVLDSARRPVFRTDDNRAPEIQADFNLSGGGLVELVRRTAMIALTSVRGQELKTFRSLVRFVSQENDRLAAIRAMQRIPRSNWPAEQVGSLMESALTYVKTFPTDERTGPAAMDALEFADALASLLPSAEAKQARARIGELGVRVIRLGTLLERMSFDKDVIAVRAGKPVEFVFENTDLMPHNFVVLQPGSLEEVGLLAEATAQQPASAERQFVPTSDKVLLGSRLLQPRDSQKLTFTAPTKPGVYPYVCTYPGHWRRMYGALYVVEDLDAYLENPDSYLAASRLPVLDAMLKDRRPRTEWKFEDLATALEDASMHGGRSYGNGKQMFTVAACVSCHKLDGIGTAIGPDLAKLDEKQTPVDILKEMLDPSVKINEKFQTFVFELQSGKVVTGLVLEESPDQVKVIENPLAKNEPIVIKKSEIAERKKSPNSIMPKGLLEKLNRDEIIDLVAYIASRGKKDAPLFRKGHHQH